MKNDLDSNIIHEYTDRYAVIVRDFHGGQRGYVVATPPNAGRSAALARLAERVNLDGFASITIAEVLLDSDEF